MKPFPKLSAMEWCTLIVAHWNGYFNSNQNMPKGWTQDVLENLERKRLLKYIGDGEYNFTSSGCKNNIAHFVSPYGQDSFMNPGIVISGKPLGEDFLWEESE